MKSLTLLQLVFLCRLIDEDLDRMDRRIQRCKRYISRGEDRHKEMALAEAERDELLSVKQKINAELALREYTADNKNES